jgi:acetolactate synthase-1/2/3 large subunit
MGPVHLTIPVDVFTSPAANQLPMPAPPERAEIAPSSQEVARALELIEAAERPVVITGSGVWWADAGDELLRFLKKSGLPHYSVTMARGIISDLSGHCLGYADGALNKALHQAFPQADLVLVLGKRIDYRLALGGPRLFSPEAKFVQVDIHQPELGVNRKLELGICADVKSTLRALGEALPKKTKSRKAWLARLKAWDQEWRDQLQNVAADKKAPMHPAAFYSMLQPALPEGVLYAWDGGDFVHWGRAMLPAEIPGGWLRLGPLGTIGSALPNAIALQLAHPNAPVLMITGDGSLGFYLAELDTIVRNNLPIVIIVGNDAGWGLERELQQGTEGTTVACELRATRYDLVMKGFGGEGENIEKLAQVGPAIKRALAARRPYLLNVNIRGTGSPFTDWQLQGRR